MSRSTEKSYTRWSNEAIQYAEHETDLENPLMRKKDIWLKITQKMVKKGYVFTQNKVESKWRSLLLSHKDLIANKNQTGAKRKSFKYFEELDAIVGKRHNINPPVIGGSNIDRNIDHASSSTEQASGF